MENVSLYLNPSQQRLAAHELDYEALKKVAGLLIREDYGDIEHGLEVDIEVVRDGDLFTVVTEFHGDLFSGIEQKIRDRVPYDSQESDSAYERKMDRAAAVVSKRVGVYRAPFELAFAAILG